MKHFYIENNIAFYFSNTVLENIKPNKKSRSAGSSNHKLNMPVDTIKHNEKQFRFKVHTF